jgi:O-antigen/teichoic acid export membrane protein
VDCMVKSEIRLKYPGIIVFASNLLSAATGLAFILMITRNVSTEEFGIWGNILDLFSYFILIAGVLPFWATRFVAREHTGSAKTGLIANIFISFAATSIYLALVPTILSVLQINSIYVILYTIVSIQMLEQYTISALEGILYAKQPQTIGYGLLISEACKVILGFVLIIELKLGLQGALYGIIISYFIRIIFYMKPTAKELKESVRWSYLKEWLKASPINIYNVVGNRIAAFTLILLFVYGGELARAYYGAAATFTTFIINSSLLAFALYPRLLSESNSEDVSISLRLVMMFAIPMTIGVMVLSDSYLTILEVVYAEARPVLLLSAISGLFLTLSQVFNTVVLGTERVDVEAKIAFKELVKSRLFPLFTLPYIQSAVILPATFFVLTSITKTPLEASTYLALITLLASLAMLIVTYVIARKCIVFNFPWNGVSKYALASLVMAVVLLLIPHPTRLLMTAALTLLGAVIYLAILTFIDNEAKSLMKSILQEFMRIIKISKPQNVN